MIYESLIIEKKHGENVEAQLADLRKEARQFIDEHIIMKRRKIERI